MLDPLKHAARARGRAIRALFTALHITDSGATHRLVWLRSSVIFGCHTNTSWGEWGEILGEEVVECAQPAGGPRHDAARRATVSAQRRQDLHRQRRAEARVELGLLERPLLTARFRPDQLRHFPGPRRRSTSGLGVLDVASFAELL